MVSTLCQHLPKGLTAPFCPTEVRETIPIVPGASLWSRFRRYAGIGFLVSVGYMDPGNWATDIEAGSRFAYGLLSVVLISSIIAMVLQTLCVRLGMASGKGIADHCREQFPKRVNYTLWALAQLAVIACDFAEVLGTALALKLLFGLPLAIGILLTAFDTLIVLALQASGELRIERIVTVLVAIISGIFLIEIIFSAPDWVAIGHGFVPRLVVFQDNAVWLVAIGILGATVMPHNLYLHSSVVSSRKLPPGEAFRKDAIRLLTADTLITLTIAFFVNAAILVVAASAFHFSGHTEVTTINEAYALLSPLLGTMLASLLFGVALLASGQSSTITGTMAGQIILQGFLKLRIPCWQQRLITRAIAIVPAWLGVVFFGEGALTNMLVMSQVVLSMQLPFAMIPLIMFTRNRSIMGDYRSSTFMGIFCWAIGGLIIAANGFLLWTMI